MSDRARPVSTEPLDSLGLFASSAGIPEQITRAAAVAHGIELPRLDHPDAVVVLGAGTGAIAGEVLVSTAEPIATVPIELREGYVLPAFVGPATVVIAADFSGSSAETVATASAAFERGATVVAISAGGELAKLATSMGAPQIEIDNALAPGRQSLGALVASLLVVVERFGVIPSTARAITSAVNQLEARCDELTASDGGVAGRLARQIGRTFPLIHGVSGIGAVAARRWKAQMNLNAKSPAFIATEPGLGHDEIAGYGQAGDVTRQLLTLVRLHTDGDDPRAVKSAARTEDLLREVVAGVLDVQAAGEGWLAQLLDLVLIGDFCSLRRAAAEGIDPGPAPALGGGARD